MHRWGECYTYHNSISGFSAFDLYSGVKLAMMLGLSKPACQGILSDSW